VGHRVVEPGEFPAASEIGMLSMALRRSKKSFNVNASPRVSSSFA
jgi:hypothetical protein